MTKPTLTLTTLVSPCQWILSHSTTWFPSLKLLSSLSWMPFHKQTTGVVHRLFIPAQSFQRRTACSFLWIQNSKYFNTHFFLPNYLIMWEFLVLIFASLMLIRLSAQGLWSRNCMFKCLNGHSLYINQAMYLLHSRFSAFAWDIRCSPWFISIFHF